MLLLLHELSLFLLLLLAVEFGLVLVPLPPALLLPPPLPPQFEFDDIVAGDDEIDFLNKIAKAGFRFTPTLFDLLLVQAPPMPPPPL